MLWLAVVYAAEPVALDLPAAVDAAWQATAERRVLQARIARAEKDAYVRLGDPEFRLGFDDVGSQLDPIQTQFRLRVPVDDLPSAMAESKARRSAADVERAELESLQEEVRLEAVARFDRVRLLEAEQALFDEELVLVERRADIVGKRLEAGVASADDVVDAAFDRAEIERRRIELDADLAVARAELLVFTGKPADAALTLTGPALRQILDATFDSRSEHVQSRIVRAQAREAELQKKAEAAARIPFLDWVQADVQTESGKVPAYGLGFAIELPIFSLLDRSVGAAKQAIAMREAELEVLEKAHQASAERDRVQLDAARAALRRLDEAIATAEAALRTHEAAMTPDEVLGYEAQLIDEKRQGLDLLEQGLEARRRLEASVRVSP